MNDVISLSCCVGSLIGFCKFGVGDVIIVVIRVRRSSSFIKGGFIRVDILIWIYIKCLYESWNVCE